MGSAICSSGTRWWGAGSTRAFSPGEVGASGSGHAREELLLSRFAGLPPEGIHLTRVASVLERKGQVILYGPPGTGKTYWAEIAARELAARSWFKKAFDQLTDGERTASLDEFFLGPRRTLCGPGELVVRLDLPRPAAGSGSAFRRLTRRRGVDLATVSVAARSRGR